MKINKLINKTHYLHESVNDVIIKDLFYFDLFELDTVDRVVMRSMPGVPGSKKRVLI